MLIGAWLHLLDQILIMEIFFFFFEKRKRGLAYNGHYPMPHGTVG